MPYDLVFPPLGICSKEMCTYMYHKEIYKNVHRSVICNSSKLKIIQMPSKEWINKLDILTLWNIIQQ